MFRSEHALQARQMIFDSVGAPPNDTVLFWQRLPLWSSSYEDAVGEWRLDGYGQEADRLGETGKKLFADMLTLFPDHRPNARSLLEYEFFKEDFSADGRSIRQGGGIHRQAVLGVTAQLMAAGLQGRTVARAKVHPIVAWLVAGLSAPIHRNWSICGN